MNATKGIDLVHVLFFPYGPQLCFALTQASPTHLLQHSSRALPSTLSSRSLFADSATAALDTCGLHTATLA